MKLIVSAILILVLNFIVLHLIGLVNHAISPIAVMIYLPALFFPIFNSPEYQRMCNGVYSYWVRPGSCVQHCNRVPFIMPSLLHSFIKICCFKRQNRKVFKATLFAIDCKYLHFLVLFITLYFFPIKGGTWTPINFAVDLILSSLHS